MFANRDRNYNVWVGHQHCSLDYDDNNLFSNIDLDTGRSNWNGKCILLWV